MVYALDWLLKHTLRSVWFGIFLLSAIAVYIAIGSGLPQVREFFEKDELAFFNAWPLGTLMFLLVVTLITVTIERIPFNPTRMGAWIIHTGIVTLVFGAFWHYSQKVEGMILIPMGQSASQYFDRWERALYLQSQSLYTRVALPELPRFHAYDQTLGNADYLKNRGLDNVMPIYNGPQVVTAGDLLGVKDLKLSITGYWPYADIRQRLVDSPDSGAIGFSMHLPDPDTGEMQDVILMAGNLKNARASWGSIDFEHRAVESQKQIADQIESTLKLHELKISLPGVEKTIAVTVGSTYELKEQGYIIRVESFDPRWPTMDKKIRAMLTLMIQTPVQTFRRQVLMDVEQPTDWLLNAEGAGPLGKRQSKPLDEALKITYTLNDPNNLLPPSGNAKYTIFTAPDMPLGVVLAVPLNEKAFVQDMTESGELMLRVPAPTSAMMTGQPRAKPDEIKIALERSNKAAVEQYVQIVPREQRDKDTGASGQKQVVRVHASAGDWNQDILVPFLQQATLMPWRGGLLDIPGAKSPAQLQLSTNLRNLPANIRLDKFEAEAYGGMQAQAGAMMRNFKSFITITDRVSGKQTPGVVSLNEPVFYDDSRWIFFQSQWDPNGQRFTVLGIGNRPGVMIMALGCGLMIFGIFYAFYIKPIIIKVKKQNALANAARDLPNSRMPLETAKTSN